MWSPSDQVALVILKTPSASPSPSTNLTRSRKASTASQPPTKKQVDAAHSRNILSIPPIHAKIVHHLQSGYIHARFHERRRNTRKVPQLLRGTGAQQVCEFIADTSRRPHAAADHRRHGAVQALLHRRGGASQQARHHIPEVLPHPEHRKRSATPRTTPSSRCWATSASATTSRQTPSISP